MKKRFQRKNVFPNQRPAWKLSRFHGDITRGYRPRGCLFSNVPRKYVRPISVTMSLIGEISRNGLGV